MVGRDSKVDRFTEFVKAHAVGKRNRYAPKKATTPMVADISLRGRRSMRA